MYQWLWRTRSGIKTLNSFLMKTVTEIFSTTRGQKYILGFWWNQHNWLIKRGPTFHSYNGFLYFNKVIFNQHLFLEPFQWNFTSVDAVVGAIHAIFNACIDTHTHMLVVSVKTGNSSYSVWVLDLQNHLII